MYFHIIVDSEIRRNIVEFDRVSVEEINEEIIKPYLLGLSFHVNGYKLDSNSVKRLTIKSTDDDIGTITNLRNTGRSRFPVTKEGTIHSDEFSKDVTRSLIRAVRKTLSNGKEFENSSNKSIHNVYAGDKLKVFIVHGHDTELLQTVARYIESLRVEVVILNEKPNAGQTIIEKFEKHSDVGFAVVLYTTCDIGTEKKYMENDNLKDKLKFRARQNVIFEHGYLVAKLGRSNVCALRKEDVEVPSDLSGVLYTKVDTDGAWKTELKEEMRVAGYVFS